MHAQTFSETLKDLLEENNLNNKQFSKAVGISEPCLSLYIKYNNPPSVKHLVMIADYFHCSTDFLLGREPFKENLTFRTCPPFSERIHALENFMKYSPKDFYSLPDISKSSYFSWKSGKRQPSLENVLALADICKRRVDYILGRES